MAERVIGKGWTGMAEHVQNRIIHLAMSLVTILVTVGGIVGGYWSIQSTNREMMAEFKMALVSLTSRVSTIETQTQAATTLNTADRLSIERRITSLENYYTQTLATLNEIKDDVRALRDGQNKQRSPQ